MALNVTFGKDTEAQLTHLYDTVKVQNQTNLRNRWEIIDKYVARESQKSADVRMARLKNQGYGDKKIIPDQESPLIYTKLSAAHSFLVNLFLRGHPIFSAVAPRELLDVGRMYNALITRDQAKFNWARNISMALRDGLKYNLMVTETEWCRQFTTRNESGKLSQVVESEGNKIKRWNPYNTFWDMSVEPSMVHKEGAYAGLVETTNYLNAKHFVHGLEDTFKKTKNLADAFSRAPCRIYYTPQILESAYNPEDWGSFFGFRPAAHAGNGTGQYEFFTLYLRLIPKEFDITAPYAGSPGTWKFIFLNGLMIYAQPLQEWDFPVVLTLPLDEGIGLQGKSFCEHLLDAQDSSSFLQTSRAASLRRAISDRALYDPTRIRPQDVNAANPSAKIAVNMNQYHTDLSSAYYAIPYRDDMAPYYAQELQIQSQLADEISGISKAFQGNFVKGNRTKTEYQDIVGNAEARLEVLGLAIASQNIHEIKRRLKKNYLTHAIVEELYDENSRQAASVNPEQMNEAADAIQLADGTLPSSKIMSAELVQVALQNIPLVPEFNQKYDTAELFVSLLKNQGLDNLDDFKRPEQPTQQPTGTPVQPTGPASGG